MLRKKITAWVLTAAMLTGLGAAAPVSYTHLQKWEF